MLAHRLRRAARPIMAFRTSGSVGNSVTIAMPAGAAVGDFAVMAWFSANNSGAPTDTAAPDGWATHQNQTGNFIGFDPRAKLMSKVLTAVDIGATYTGFDGDEATDTKVIVVFKSTNRPFTSAVYAAGGGECTQGNPAAQAANASAVKPPVLVLAVLVGDDTAPAFSTASPAWDDDTIVEEGSFQGLRVGYKIYNSTPSDHSYDMADDGTNWMAGGYWTLN